MSLNSETAQFFKDLGEMGSAQERQALERECKQLRLSE